MTLAANAGASVGDVTKTGGFGGFRRIEKGFDFAARRLRRCETGSAESLAKRTWSLRCAKSTCVG